MNLNKKTGERNPIFELVRITGDAENLFSSVPLTRRLLGGGGRFQSSLIYVVSLNL